VRRKVNARVLLPPGIVAKHVERGTSVFGEIEEKIRAVLACLAHYYVCQHGLTRCFFPERGMITHRPLAWLANGRVPGN